MTPACEVLPGPRPDSRACPACGDELQPYLEDDLYGRGQRWAFPSCRPCDAAAQAQQARVERLARLMLQGREFEFTFETYTPRTPSQRSALEMAQAGGSLWLVGPPGVGKTHLATAACIAALEEREAWVNRCKAPDLFAILRDKAMGEGIEDDVRALSECELLVLDDLDKARPTPFVHEQLYRIAEARSLLGLRTIVTTNTRPSDVGRIYGGAFVSRMRSLCPVVEVRGEDGRMTERKCSDER